MRKLLIFSFGVLTACLLCAQLSARVTLIIFGVLCVVAASAALLHRYHLAILWLLLGFTIGLVSFQCYDRTYIAPTYELDGEYLSVDCVCSDDAEKTDWGARIKANVKELGRKGLTVQINYYGAGEDLPIAGDVLRVEGKFHSVRLKENAGRFLAEGVQMKVNVNHAFVTGHVSSHGAFFKSVSRAFRQRIEEIFEPESSAFLKALLCGDKSSLKQDRLFYNALSDTGISHMLVVSGMHVSLLSGFVMLIFGKGKFGLIVSGVVCLLFGAIVGYTNSVIRACVMMLFTICSRLLLRENDTLTSLGAACAFILILNPWAVYSISFQLSFGATFGILVLAEPIFNFLTEPFPKLRSGKGKIHRFLRKIIYALSVSTGATLTVTPILLRHFDGISVLTPLTNLFASPVAEVIFAIGFAAVCVSYLYLPAAVLLGRLGTLLVRILRWFILLLNELPMAVVSSTETGLFICFGFIIVGACILRFTKSSRIHYLIYTGVCVLLLSCNGILNRVYQANAASTVTVLDVGQGQSIVIRYPNGVAVVDCGSGSGEDAGDICADYLRSIGAKQIDALILTHFDADHINGVNELLTRAECKAVYVPVSQKDDAEILSTFSLTDETKCVRVRTPKEISFNGGRIAVIPPSSQAENNAGCLAVLESCGDFDALITGDLPFKSERLLLEQYEMPDTELLIVGHHGSKNSTCEELLNAIQPELAVISVGANSYGHPSTEVLERLTSYEVKCLRTDLNGSITIRVRENGKNKR